MYLKSQAENKRPFGVEKSISGEKGIKFPNFQIVMSQILPRFKGRTP